MKKLLIIFALAIFIPTFATNPTVKTWSGGIEVTWKNITLRADSALVYPTLATSILSLPYTFSWQTLYSGVSAQDTVYSKIQVSDSITNTTTAGLGWLLYSGLKQDTVTSNTITYCFDSPFGVCEKHIRLYNDLAVKDTVVIVWSKLILKYK